MTLASPYLDRAIIMDKGNTDTFYGELRRSLRQSLDDQERLKIKKIKPQDSKHNNLLQLVDYVAGVSSRKMQDKRTGRSIIPIFHQRKSSAKSCQRHKKTTWPISFENAPDERDYSAKWQFHYHYTTFFRNQTLF